MGFDLKADYYTFTPDRPVHLYATVEDYNNMLCPCVRFTIGWPGGEPSNMLLTYILNPSNIYKDSKTVILNFIKTEILPSLPKSIILLEKPEEKDLVYIINPDTNNTIKIPLSHYPINNNINHCVCWELDPKNPKIVSCIFLNHWNTIKGWIRLFKVWLDLDKYNDDF